MQNRIVVVDDDPTMRSALREVLSNAGWEAELFSNGAEAAQYLRRNGADLVISDMRMPELGGIELLLSVAHSLVYPCRLLARFRERCFGAVQILAGGSRQLRLTRG